MTSLLFTKYLVCFVRLVSNYLKPLNKIENLEFNDTAKTYLLTLSVKLIFHMYILFVSREVEVNGLLLLVEGVSFSRQ